MKKILKDALLLIVRYSVNGLAIFMLWGWFVVPTFNLPPLPLVPAIGIAIMLECIAGQKGRNGELTNILTADIVDAAGALGIGWALHFFM